MNLYTYLRHKDVFSKEECSIIAGAFTEEKIHKGKVIANFQKYAGRVLFLEEGILRTFFFKDGKDITHFFFDENCFIAPVNSILYKNKTERYQWEAVEDCRVSMIAYEDFWALEERFPRLSRVIIEFSLYLLDLFSQKLNMLQFQSAAERYDSFLEMYPSIAGRVSLGSTASFLGITQQTLSVIRGKKK
ncbi:Crp/Fnr family transcriptional regulator [Lewinella sp. 4G2]|uniref:Crp/Fnr family transcriptional regulator n=1 Tax=Lewinella sp. 4G2 TaxID=1803372 RepID=UPI0007B45E63|nr:Crp/Fnr family transcriptional regulator [Lewinella sp. 4G2]OAV44058.1 hypothetical protein A3850_005905 [Lewinella sp. 4G2]